MPDLREQLQDVLGDTYRLERELSGGMSRVFVAEEVALARKVVIKVLPSEMGASVDVARFRREIQLAAKLQHPHIVPVLSAGEVLGRPYFTMPFVEGESLRTRLDRTGDLPLPDAVRILREVASALAYAHRHSIVHRDIKPDNVLISDDFALVTDFGVAKALKASEVEDVPSVTTAGVVIGTPEYMSPEQVSGDPHLDHRSDIYSFGILAYEMVTGATPFSGRNTHAMLAAHAIVPPDPIERHRPNLAPWLGEVIMRCLEKRPSDRPQTASEIVHLLQQSDEVSRSGQTIDPYRRTPARRGLLIAAGLAFVVLASAGTFFFRSRSSPSDPGIQSVAVLPLVNVGGTAQDDYFSDGMSDELANALNRIPGLRVASRTSSYTFKNRKDVDVGEIGRKLNVQAVLEGTVRRAGTKLKITGQLTSTRDGLSLWSDSYERNADDVFSVQEDIARSIVMALQPRLSKKTPVVATHGAGTTNVDAYDAYLRGRYLWNARGADNLKNAIGHFDRAIAQDPNFSRAYAARAMAYALLPEYTDAGPKDASERSIADARRALSGDSTLAEAHTAIALASVHEWDWNTAEAAYKRAIAADPGYPTAHQWYGELLYNTSRLDSSIAETRRARNLDPLAPILSTALGYALTIARRYDEALLELKRGLELAPNLGVMHSVYGFANLFAGKTLEARGELETAVRNDPDLVLRKGQLAYVYAMTGDQARARTIVDEMKRNGASEEAHQVAFAIVYVALGEKDKALSLLESAVQKRDIGLLTAASPLDDPTYDPIRNDPRFVRILEQMNLAQFRH